jgi:hypothetical protein
MAATHATAAKTAAPKTAGMSAATTPTMTAAASATATAAARPGARVATCSERQRGHCNNHHFTH